MSYVLNCEQIKTLEQNAVQLGLGWLRLMENAGSAAAKEIRNRIDSNCKKIVILCGKGNNGGDGYVIARKLTDYFDDIKVISVDSPSTDSAKEMYTKAVDLGIKPIPFKLNQSICMSQILEADLIIDCLFGIGFHGEPDDITKLIINTVNSTNAIKVAIDVPSGINCDNNTVDNICLKADITITFSAYKPCQIFYPAAKFCGETKLVSIGIPNEAFNGIEPEAIAVTEEFVTSLLPVREPDCHKGTNGTAGLFVGNIGYSGAAVIAGKAAVKSGVGIANMIIPEAIYNIVGTSIPEAICTIIKGDSYESIHENDADKIIKALNNSTVSLLGCGLGRSLHIKNILKRILKECNIPLIIDADGINQLTDCIELINQYKAGVVLTPHPKEASRLLDCQVEDIQNNRLIAVKEITKRTNAVTVLKGANTLISMPDGTVFVVTDGNPGMATAGTGDMLAGMITAFIAQGLNIRSSAICGVKIHAMSGDEAVIKSSVLSLTPTDMINTLPDIFLKLYKK